MLFIYKKNRTIIKHIHFWSVSNGFSRTPKQIIHIMMTMEDLDCKNKMIFLRITTLLLPSQDFKYTIIIAKACLFYLHSKSWIIWSFQILKTLIWHSFMCLMLANNSGIWISLALLPFLIMLMTYFKKWWEKIQNQIQIGPHLLIVNIWNLLPFLYLL